MTLRTLRSTTDFIFCPFDHPWTTPDREGRLQGFTQRDAHQAITILKQRMSQVVSFFVHLFKIL